MHDCDPWPVQSLMGSEKGYKPQLTLSIWEGGHDYHCWQQQQGSKWRKEGDHATCGYWAFDLAKSLHCAFNIENQVAEGAITNWADTFCLFLQEALAIAIDRYKTATMGKKEVKVNLDTEHFLPNDMWVVILMPSCWLNNNLMRRKQHSAVVNCQTSDERDGLGWTCL